MVTYHHSQNDATNNTNAIKNPITNNANNQSIYYRISVISNTNCFATASFKLVVNKLPKANPISTITACDDDTNNGYETFNLLNNNTTILGNQSASEFNITYHISQVDANTKANALPANYQNTSNPQTIFARIENKENTTCFTTTSFTIEVSKKPIIYQVFDLKKCADGQTTIFDLTQLNNSVLGVQNANDFIISYHASLNEAQTGQNPLTTNHNSNSSNQTIYVRLENKHNKQCFAINNFAVITQQKPVINMGDVYSICQGSTVTITAPAGFDSYLWSTGVTTNQVILSQDGQYSLTVTKNYGTDTCDRTHSFNVYNSNIATIQEVKIQDWNDHNNTINVIAMGDGDYEFSLDGLNYQNSPIFNNLSAGNYTVFVKDKKGCGIATKEVYLLTYPKYFTPNNDGFNDTWKINFSENEPSLIVSIFDRFGKLLKTMASNTDGWDGNFSGNPLPADDYWFVVKREKGNEYKGHFSLKR